MNALGDFMLRILIVCAIVSIIFDEAFATSANDRKTGKEYYVSNLFSLD